MDVLFGIGNLFIEHEEALMMKQWEQVMGNG
jgi:nitrogenase molybdenum-iron protein NifN